jgi:ABC-type multidrug transport system, ATPase component
LSNVIEIKNLKKYYGDVRAVDDISFSVERGTLFAFLGKNGAGKSTTINVLSTLLKKDAGTVIVDGVDLDDNADGVRKNIGIVFQNSVLDNKLRVKDNLTVRASFYGLRGAEWSKRLSELTEMLSLESILDRPFGKLSGGQKR